VVFDQAEVLGGTIDGADGRPAPVDGSVEFPCLATVTSTDDAADILTGVVRGLPLLATRKAGWLKDMTTSVDLVVAKLNGDDNVAARAWWAAYRADAVADSERNAAQEATIAEALSRPLLPHANGGIERVPVGGVVASDPAAAVRAGTITLPTTPALVNTKADASRARAVAKDARSSAAAALNTGDLAFVKTDGAGHCLVRFTEASQVGSDTKKPATQLKVEWWKKHTSWCKTGKWVPWLGARPSKTSSSSSSVRTQSSTLVPRGTVVMLNVGILSSSVVTGPVASQSIRLKAATSKLLRKLEKKDEESEDGESDFSEGSEGE
jgi:hypothetical protein